MTPRFASHMSAIGPKQTLLIALHMSAFRGKADMKWVYYAPHNAGESWHDKSGVDGSTSIGGSLHACRSR